MWQVLFYLPIWHIPVYGYGVMLVIGFIGGMLLAQYLARRVGLDPELFANAAIVALVFGVIGARLSHVLENLPQYTRSDLTVWGNLWNAINIREGGLTYYGGFLLATPACIIYGMIKRVPIPLGMDIIAPCLMVGLAFGRIGCFLNGCCYGAATNVSWAVEFPFDSDAYITQFTQNQLHRSVPRDLIRDNSALGAYMDQHNIAAVNEPLELDDPMLSKIDGTSLKPRDQIVKEAHNVVGMDGKTTIADLVREQKANPVHPAEIYSSVTAFLIAAFLVAYFSVCRVPGHVFAAMMMIEGLFRYVLEMLRVEPAVVGQGTSYFKFLPPQSYSMVVSFFLVTGGIILWFYFSHRRRGERAAGQMPGRVAIAGV